MNPTFSILASLGCCLLAFSGLAGPVLRVVTDQAGGANLVRHGDFENGQGTVLTGWSAAPNGFRVAPGEGRNGSQALACEAPDATGWRGASQNLTLNRTAAAPLIVSGWSKAADVTGGRDSGYSLYVDLVYQDGTPLWGQTANFATGTHDWERREVLILPEKPVRSLTLYCLFRGHAGRVWFDDVAVTEVAASGDALLFQGTPMQWVAPTDLPTGTRDEYASADGLQLTQVGQQVVSLTVAGRELAGPAAGGFWARDVAANSDVFGFEEGQCPELGLALTTSVQVRADHLVIDGRLQDLRGSDRAILLLFALPVEAAGWSWGDDIRRQRPITGRGEYTQATAVGCGTTGTLSLYPVAAVSDDRTGLALALDPGEAAVYRLVYHAGTRQFFIAYDFGLVQDTERMPGATTFRFIVYRFDPAWGFRAAWAKFMDIFPEHFEVRSKEQGIWMPFTDVSTVQGWEDFGFRYHEGNNNVAWDDAHGVLSFRYTEPMTWWMPMQPDLPRTREEALRVRDAYAAGRPGNHQRMAEVSRAAAMFEADEHPALLFRNEPWANGAVWSLNPNPHLPASPNAATVHWDDAIKERLYGANVAARLDGEYLDSLEGYVTADLNFRREHFRYSTVPLTFTADTRQPVLFKGLAIYEFTRWLSRDVRSLGALMFANGVPYRFGFLCPWLDVLGTETNWLPGDEYQPVADSQLCLWRTLSGRKPYLLLMNTDYSRFTPDLVERYFQRSLFYGMFPSMFSHNAAENPYWRNPTWYNRDRPLFRRYIPLIKQVAEAGWQPVTDARCDNPNVDVERYGPTAEGVTFLTLWNATAQTQTGRLRWLGQQAPATAPGPATELLGGTPLTRTDSGWEIEVAAGRVALVRVEPGPRFVQAESTSQGRLRLTIASPPGFTQVLEASGDLREWSAVEAHTPAAGLFTVEVARVANVAGQFFRLRW